MEPQVTQNPEPLNNPQNIPPDSIPENPKLKLNIKRLLFLITIIILLAISSVAAFSIYKNLTDNSDNQIACTMDAKICPDGSAVGRSGPNCEFAPCPTTTSSDSSLNGYHGDEYTFDYPDKWIKVENKDLIESFDDFLFFQNQTQAEEFKECNKPDNFPNDCGVIAKIGLISNTVNSDPSHPNIQTYIDTTGKEWGIRIDEADGNWYFKTIIDDENVLSITISMLRYSKAAGFPSNTAGKTAYGSAFDAVKMILSTFKFTEIEPNPDLELISADKKSQNIAIEYLSANIRYYTMYLKYPWQNVNACTTAAGSTTPQGVTLLTLNSCTSELIKQGELKGTFSYGNEEDLSKIFLTNSNTSSELRVCFKPVSSVMQSNNETRFGISGQEEIGCISSGGTKACYWCLEL